MTHSSRDKAAITLVRKWGAADAKCSYLGIEGVMTPRASGSAKFFCPTFNRSFLLLKTLPLRQYGKSCVTIIKMITKFITEVNTRFNPFAPKSKTCRVFLAQFGPQAWSNIKFTTKMLPRHSRGGSSLKIKFQDGKEMTLNTEKQNFKDIAEEVDRHSRMLNRKAELAG